MAPRFPAAKPLIRKSGRAKQPKPKIVVVCEGKVTEPQYFLDFARLHAYSLVSVLPIGGCGVPLSVVQRAVAEKNLLAAASRKSKDSFEKYFEVWAAFDRDEHPESKTREAIALAQTSGIYIAYSNPCFEVWGLMHYSCYARPGHHHETQSALKAILPGFCHETHPVFNLAELQPRYPTAVLNSARAMAARDAEGSPKGDPSTSVHLLTERIRSFGRD